MKNINNWIYKKTKDNNARFVLWEKWIKTLICFGINPSTAIPWKLDNTLRIVKKISSNFWYDSWIMLNIYPQRATNPNDLDETINKIYHKENLKYIKNIFKKNSIDTWVAWWWLIEKRPYLIDCLFDVYHLLKWNNINWYSIGKKTKKWHPHHPLYLNNNLKFDKFDIDDYIYSLKNDKFWKNKEKYYIIN